MEAELLSAKEIHKEKCEQLEKTKQLGKRAKK